MRSTASTTLPTRIIFILVLAGGCAEVNVDETAPGGSGSETKNTTSTTNSAISPTEQTGMELIRNPSTGEEAVIYKPFKISTELPGGLIYRKAGSIQSPNEPVSPAEQEAIDYLANDVGVIVSAKELCNAVDNPGKPYANFVNINDEQAAVIATLENLEWMDLQYAELADSSLEYFSGLKKLQYLNLGNNEEITDEGLKHLTGLNLIFLNLSGCNGITNDGLEVLSNLTTLRHLVLRNCDGISEDGFEHLGKLTELRELSVSGDYLNGFGLVHLKNLPSLEHLGISNGVVKLPFDELMQHLSEFESLKRLFVQKSLTFEQTQELAKAFPNLSFR